MAVLVLPELLTLRTSTRVLAVMGPVLNVKKRDERTELGGRVAAFQAPPFKRNWTWVMPLRPTVLM